jgi:phytanoyl-CoA hydroxylase
MTSRNKIDRTFMLLLLLLLAVLMTGATSSTSLPHSPCGSDVADRFDRDGYVVCPGLFAPSEIHDLRAEIASIARGERGPVQGVNNATVAARSRGATINDNDNDNDNDAADDDARVLSNYLAFHHPHKLSPLIKEALRHPRLVQVLTKLIGPNVKSMQSMYFVKSAGKPGQAWHQDEQYIPTRDRSLTGAFIAIDDADVENGCLWMHPGSHRAGVLHRMAAHEDPRFDPSGEAQDFPPDYDREGGAPCEAASGTVVFFHGYVLHRSLPNRSPSRSRHALVGHYMTAESWLPWDADGTISPFPRDNRDVFMVAGADPYAYRGYVDHLTKPFVRPASIKKGRKGAVAGLEGGVTAAAMVDVGGGSSSTTTTTTTTTSVADGHGGGAAAAAAAAAVGYGECT